MLIGRLLGGGRKLCRKLGVMSLVLAGLNGLPSEPDREYLVNLVKGYPEGRELSP